MKPWSIDVRAKLLNEAPQHSHLRRASNSCHLALVN
jgi:hypothetical protein